MSRIAELIHRTCRGVAQAHGVGVNVEYEPEYPATVNDVAETEFALDVAADLVGAPAVVRLGDPLATSEDFSRVLAAVPGAMLLLGALPEGREVTAAPSLHSARAEFSDEALPTGASLYAALAARRLAAFAHAVPDAPADSLSGNS